MLLDDGDCCLSVRYFMLQNVASGFVVFMIQNVASGFVVFMIQNVASALVVL